MFELNINGGWIIPEGSIIAHGINVPGYSMIGNNCTFTENCTFAENCIFGNNCTFGKKPKIQIQLRVRR